MIHPEQPQFSLEEELAMWQMADSVADELLGKEATELMCEFIHTTMHDAAEIDGAREREIANYVNTGIRALADYVRGGSILVSETEDRLRYLSDAQLSGDPGGEEWFFGSSLKESEMKQRERIIRTGPNRKLEHKLAKIERGNNPHERA